jgi:predicted SprT family Zn-dependent metalloprotease
MKTLQHKIEIVTDSIWLGLIESYPKLVRFDAPKIVLCNRLTRTAGKNYQTENRIHLANKFFANNHSEMMLTILPHEIAHQADYNIFGLSEKKCGHGKNWAKIMVELGLPANKYHSLEI